ncbi:MAG: trehalose-6-phosphate synthase [Candidatus Eisenbacteria bacterium]|nr:trehalose-6-phosphate synthase [Candidatus Eisenbacteria bacterium]
MRLIVVSNRLPIRLVREDRGWTSQPASGGLVTALSPVLRNRGGIWIGWPGVAGDFDEGEILGPASREAGHRLHPVRLSEVELKSFYHGFTNQIIWPLFHDLFTRCNFSSDFWRTYLKINARFADAIIQHHQPDDYVWVQDYHLMQVGHLLRRRGHGRYRTGFFLHIPFPPPDVFVKLPWRSQILRGLLDYDLVGFQTIRDRRNFVHCLRHLVREAKVQGRGPVISVRYGDRMLRLGCFPIGIGFDEFSEVAKRPETAERVAALREAHGTSQLMLSVDRLDYTKGIPERLEGFRRALARYPSLHEKITLIQQVVPSRDSVPEYQRLQTDIETLIAKINGQFTRPGWIPVHYLYRSMPREELVAHYRAADIGLITPLKDGMNLVAKEFCACDVDRSGALILSEFAGAAIQLRTGALLVNPYDYEGVAEAIRRAFLMPPEERRMRMHKLRTSVRKTDIAWWADSFMEAAFARTLHDFPHDERDLTEDFPRQHQHAAAGRRDPSGRRAGAGA